MFRWAEHERVLTGRLRRNGDFGRLQGAQKLHNLGPDFRTVRFKREMARVEKHHLRVGIIPRERVRSRREKKGIAVAPDKERRRPWSRKDC